MTINKYCTSCGTNKDTSEFYKNKARQDGIDVYCKICSGIKRARRLKEDPAARKKHNEQSSAYRARDKKKAAEKDLKWRTANPERVLAAAQKYRSNLKLKYLENPNLRAEHNFNRLLKRYKLTAQQYKEIFDSQNGQCAICDGTVEVIDHCHITEKVRGLLCHRCNKGIGHFQDNLDLLKKAIEYLNI